MCYSNCCKMSCPLLSTACVRKVGGVVLRRIAMPRSCAPANWFIAPTSANAARLATASTAATLTRPWAPAVAAQTGSYYTPMCVTYSLAKSSYTVYSCSFLVHKIYWADRSLPHAWPQASFCNNDLSSLSPFFLPSSSSFHSLPCLKFFSFPYHSCLLFFPQNAARDLGEHFNLPEGPAEVKFCAVQR